MQDLNRVIAVIDDDPSVLKGLSLLLRVSGYETEVFASAEAFLQVATTSHANYLVADIHLEGMSGDRVAAPPVGIRSYNRSDLDDGGG